MKILSASAVVLSALAGEVAAEPVTVRFDGNEAPVSSATFEHRGARFTGGRIATEGAPSLYASGAFFYDVTGEASGNASSGAREVTFAQPVTGVRFFFVHGFGHDAGTARALDAAGNVVGTVQSRRASYFGAPANVASFDTATPIARITFDGGVIDDFTFDAATAAFSPTTALNGSWVSTATTPFLDGQGLFLEYAPENRALFVAWFTYGATGHRWLTAQGELTGDTANLAIFESANGAFNAPSTVSRTNVGTMTVRFASCEAGSVTFDLPGENRSGIFAVKRLRAIVTGDGACSRAN